MIAADLLGFSHAKVFKVYSEWCKKKKRKSMTTLYQQEGCSDHHSLHLWSAKKHLRKYRGEVDELEQQKTTLGFMPVPLLSAKNRNLRITKMGQFDDSIKNPPNLSGFSDLYPTVASDSCFWLMMI